MASAEEMWKFVSRLFNDRLHPYNDCELQCPEKIAYRFKTLEQNECTRFVVKRRINACVEIARCLFCKATQLQLPFNSYSKADLNVLMILTL